jgi:hypothetical protein
MTFLTARTASNGSSAAPLSITISPTVDMSTAAAANTATSTPLLLQRGESTYSETSISAYTRPPLKMTPLAGNWADEAPTWETPTVVIHREPSFEEALAADDEEVNVTLSPMHDSASESAATTAVFEEQPTVVMAIGNPYAMSYADEAALPEKFAAAVEPASAAAADAAHVLYAYQNNPYSMSYATTELPRCDCLDCAAASCRQSAAQQPPQRAMGGGNPYGDMVDAEPEQPMQPPFAQQPMQPQYQQQHHHADQWVEEQQPAAPMRFVVPPPPPKIVRRVMSESVDGSMEGAADCVQRMYYSALMRWHAKVAEQEVHFFADAADHCPAPDAGAMEFDEWAAAAAQWWLRHVEHAE